MATPIRRRNPDSISRDSFAPLHSNFMMLNSVVETALRNQTRAMTVLTRRSVKRIRCLTGKRTARNLSTVMNIRFDIEKFEEIMKMFAQSSPSSHGSALCLTRPIDLNAITAKPTNISDRARLSRSLSNSFLLLQRSISIISTVFENRIISASITKVVSLAVESIVDML